MHPELEVYQESTQWIDSNGGVITLFLTQEKTEDYLYRCKRGHILRLNTSQISIAMVLFSI